MTPNPECVNVETTILEALHVMHDGKFLHLPVLDRGKDTSIAFIQVGKVSLLNIPLIVSVVQMDLLLLVLMS